MVSIQNILILFLAAIFLSCERMDTVEASYSNSEAAIRSGAVGDGKWIPVFLPLSAVDIREKHNVDTNEIWLFFSFNSADSTFMLQSCKQIPERKIRYPRKKPSSKISWWPQSLIMNNPGKNIVYLFYQCKEDGFMAINREKTEAFYWYTGN